jgi:hypothetical protein
VLFKDSQLDDIRSGRVTVSFRRWKQPRVRVGGVYRIRNDLAIRVLAIAHTDDGSRFRVDFERCDAPADERAELARTAPTDESIEGLVAKLADMDRRTRTGAWTHKTLELIRNHPGRRAADLAPELTLPTLEFKARVRRLKALGLTESLEVGYRLSVRGAALHQRVLEEGLMRRGLRARTRSRPADRAAASRYRHRRTATRTRSARTQPR